MTEFTQHEQQQIQRGEKTQRRFPVEPQPPEGSTPWGAFVNFGTAGQYFCLGFGSAQTTMCFRESPYKPGDRIPCDGGCVVVGDVRVQRLLDMEEFDSVREGMDSEVDHADPAFINQWNTRHPNHQYETNPFVVVLDGLTWENTDAE